MTPQDKQPGKCCDKCRQWDYEDYGSGNETDILICSNPDCECHKQPGLEEVLKEFDEKFNKRFEPLIPAIDRTATYLDIKDFISRVYSIAYKNGREEMEKEIEERCESSYQLGLIDGREEAIKEINDKINPTKQNNETIK